MHPPGNVRRWRAATGQNTSLRSHDLKIDARAAWNRFVACVSALPPDLAPPLWEAVQAQAAAALTSAQ